MSFDYSNWEQEREFLIDDILTLLREQEDSTQQARISGEFQISPSTFKEGNHVIHGPVGFGKPFKQAPTITFGQRSDIVASDTRPTNVGSNYTPFLVQPYVYNWQLEAGVVEGFYVGLYAISVPSTLPVSHVVSWNAAGESTRYNDENITESWTDSYDYLDIGYLTDYPGEGE